MNYLCIVQKFITYKNCKIAFSVTGKGASIILLHGFLENSSMWNEITSELSKRNRVICIDLLGHGQTDSLGYVHSMEEIAESVKAVLTSLRIRRAIFIGHSMGGYVALAFAEKYPKNVKKICLLNSTAQADTEERKKLRKRAIQMAQTNYKSLVQISVGNLFAKASHEKFALAIKNCKKEALKTTVQGYIACTEGMLLRKNREHILASKNYETLSIVGKKDSILNTASVIKEINRTQTQFFELSGGHMSHIENNIEVLKILKDFTK